MEIDGGPTIFGGLEPRKRCWCIQRNIEGKMSDILILNCLIYYTHRPTLYTLPRSTPSRVGSIDVPASIPAGGGSVDGAIPVIPDRKIPIDDVDDDDVDEEEFDDALSFVVDDDEDEEKEDGANADDDGTEPLKWWRVTGTNADTLTVMTAKSLISLHNESKRRRSMLYYPMVSAKTIMVHGPWNGEC